MGIYFLKDKEEIVYVGKSKHIEVRIEWHKKSGVYFTTIDQ